MIVVIVVVVLASSSSSFFTFIVVITPPPHDAIPPLPLALWLDGVVMVRSVHNDRTDNAILADTIMTPAHADAKVDADVVRSMSFLSRRRAALSSRLT